MGVQLESIITFKYGEHQRMLNMWMLSAAIAFAYAGLLRGALDINLISVSIFDVATWLFYIILLVGMGASYATYGARDGYASFGEVAVTIHLRDKSYKVAYVDIMKMERVGFGSTGPLEIELLNKPMIKIGKAFCTLKYDRDLDKLFDILVQKTNDAKGRKCQDIGGTYEGMIWTVSWKDDA